MISTLKVMFFLCVGNFKFFSQLIMWALVISQHCYLLFHQHKLKTMNNYQTPELSVNCNTKILVKANLCSLIAYNWMSPFSTIRLKVLVQLASISSIGNNLGLKTRNKKWQQEELTLAFLLISISQSTNKREQTLKICNHYIKPTLSTQPDKIIPHIETNNLKDSNSADITTAMENPRRHYYTGKQDQRTMTWLRRKPFITNN